MKLFIEPLSEGWVYPCTLEDIESQLKLVPDEDLEGLWAVGLAPSTKNDCSADGRYRKTVKPRITLYSYLATLTYRQPARTKRSEIEHWKQIGRAYGMMVREEGSRWVCQWQAQDLRRFVLEHVLIHEIGHHVHHKQREREGLTGPISRQIRERFAEDYAIRWQRNMGLLSGKGWNDGCRNALLEKSPRQLSCQRLSGSR